KLELGEKTAALFALEAKEKQLADELAAARNELAAKGTAFEDAERMLAATQAELTQTSGNFHESSVTADSQRVELVALRAQTEALKGQIEAYEQEAKELGDRFGHKISEAESLAVQVAEERGRADHHGNRVGELERALIAQSTESEVLARRVEELNA